MFGEGEPAKSNDWAEVTVHVPGLLSRFTAGQRSVPLWARTVAEAIERLRLTYPDLQPHLHDDHGALRPHLQLFLNGSVIVADEADAVDLTSGDEIVVLQAVSGG